VLKTVKCVVISPGPRGLKELMDELNVDPGSVVRWPLNEQLRRAGARARDLAEKLKDISDEEVAKPIREDRIALLR